MGSIGDDVESILLNEDEVRQRINAVSADNKFHLKHHFFLFRSTTSNKFEFVLLKLYAKRPIVIPAL